MRTSLTAICQLFAWAVASGQETASRPGESAEAPIALSPAAILGLPAAPLDEPIVTDRPDFTESSQTVPYGHVQLEMGYTFTQEREYTLQTREHTVPEFLFRIGLIEHLELRIGWAGYTYAHTRERITERTDSGGYRTSWSSGWEQGGSDLYLGAKLEVCDQDGLIPQLAVMGALTVPSGSTGFSSGDVEPNFVLLYTWDLSERFSLAGNTGLFILREGTHRFLQTTQSVSLAYDIMGPLGGYVEYFVFAPDAIGQDCAHNANTGLTWLLTDNIQLDWRIGMGLNERAPDFFTGVGLSVRF